MNLFSTSPIWPHYSLAFIRVFVGAFMVYHGWEVFNDEKMNTYLQWDQFKDATAVSRIYVGKSAELAGGLLLSAGLWTRVASLLIAVTMFYISFFVGTGKIW
jgi:putative oxidoreductase